MASPAQVLANRENAQHSSGPKTQEGKQASSRNSVRHGLTGTQIIMPGKTPLLTRNYGMVCTKPINLPPKRSLFL